jgi:hypothetical protein
VSSFGVLEPIRVPNHVRFSAKPKSIKHETAGFFQDGPRSHNGVIQFVQAGFDQQCIVHGSTHRNAGLGAPDARHLQNFGSCGLHVKIEKRSALGVAIQVQCPPKPARADGPTQRRCGQFIGYPIPKSRIRPLVKPDQLFSSMDGLV